MQKINNKKTIFSTPWFNVEEKTVNGLTAPYFSLKSPDYVTILAVTREERVLLVRQYRPALEADTLELPSGYVGLNEAPEAAARRELSEETGYKARDVEMLGALDPNTGRLSNKLWCFFACNVDKIKNLSAEKEIELVYCDVRQLADFIKEGKLSHAMDLSVIALAALRKKIKF